MTAPVLNTNTSLFKHILPTYFFNNITPSNRTTRMVGKTSWIHFTISTFAMLARFKMSINLRVVSDNVGTKITTNHYSIHDKHVITNATTVESLPRSLTRHLQCTTNETLSSPQILFALNLLCHVSFPLTVMHDPNTPLSRQTLAR